MYPDVFGPRFGLDQLPGAVDWLLRTFRERDLAGAGITHWELFTLRDADSSRDGMFYRFGILRDDYSRKPAFARLRTLIAELGRPAPL
jgi:hypothetical protein